MLGHGLIRTPPLTRETIEHFIHLAAEAGADERKLRELAAEGTERLLTCPEFAFVWQHTWPEYSTAPELILAVNVGYEQKVLELLKRGEDPNATYKDGVTPLILAAAAARERILGYLLSAGASANSQASDGRTALILAAYGHNTAIAKRLLEAHANVNIAANDG